MKCTFDHFYEYFAKTIINNFCSIYKYEALNQICFDWTQMDILYLKDEEKLNERDIAKTIIEVYYVDLFV